MKPGICRAIYATASVAALAVSSGPALAQQVPEAKEADGPEIVVTGTNIRGITVVGNAVLTIGSGTIAESGMASIADIMRELPSNLAGGVATSDEVQSGQDTGAGSANLTGGQGVNLRGLGALSTLVLVNGRRAPGSGQFGNFVDISTLPTVAIERVEVLLDGASAVYGSDAVGGVVNMILATRAQNAVTTLKVGTATQGGGTEYLAGHMQPINWSTGNVLLAAEYYRREAVRATSRNPYRGSSDFRASGGVDWRSFTARYAPQTNIYNGAPTIGSDVRFTVPIGANNALTLANLLPSDVVGNTVNIYERTDILPKTERYSLYGALNQEISDSVEIYGQARYSNRKNTSELGYALLIGLLPASSPHYITGIVPAGEGIPFGTQIDDRPTTRVASVNSYSATLGLRAGLFGDWEFDTATTYAAENQNRVARGLRTAGGDSDIITCALAGPAGTDPACAGRGAITLNPFSTEPLTAAQLDQYFGVEDLTFNSDIWQATGKVDGTLFHLPAGAVRFAGGVEWRREAIEGYLTTNILALEPRSGPYTRTQRDTYSVFGELNVPLLDKVTVNLASRYEKFVAEYGSRYSDFNPKAGVDFDIADGVRLRASWGTSFHAPPMRFENDDPQPLPGGNAAFILTASRFAPCDTTLVDLNGLRTSGGQCSFSLLINAGGAGPGKLKPEQAETWTLGIDLSPPSIPGFKASLGYFNISVDNRIERIEGGGLNAILAAYFATNGGGPFAAAITIPTVAQAQAIIDSGKFLGTFGPQQFNTAADIQMIVNATQINIASLKEEGLDFNLQYDTSLSSGWDLGGYANGTYLLTYKTQGAKGLPYQDELGKYSSFGSPVKLRSQLGLRFGKSWFKGSLAANYVDGYECDINNCYVPGPGGSPVLNSAPVKINSWLTFDAALNFDLSGLGSFMTGTSAILTVNNIFDRAPPFIDGGSPNSETLTAYDPANHTIIGRTVGLLIRKKW